MVAKAVQKIIGEKLKNFDSELLRGITSSTSSSVGEVLGSQGDFLKFKNIPGKRNASLDTLLGSVTGGILPSKSKGFPFGKGLFK